MHAGIFSGAYRRGRLVAAAGTNIHSRAEGAAVIGNVFTHPDFRSHGLGEYCTSEYTRVRGHGHGLHLDEFPVVEGSETVLEPGVVLIVHPNTFTPLAGYHVLGDPVVVTEDGHAPLLRSGRELAEVAA